MMCFRLARHRFKTEWIKIFAVLFCILLLLWFDMTYINPSMVIIRSYEEFERLYGNEYLEKNRAKLAFNSGLDNEDVLGETPMEGFQALRRLYRGFCHIKLIMGSDKIIILLTSAMAVLFISSLFTKRRLGPLLAAGYSRGRLFSSLTFTYFGSVAMLWIVSVPIMLRAYGISFSPDEYRFYWITQLSWFLETMTAAAFSYLFFFLLRGTLLPFFASIAAYSLVAAIRPDWSAVPVKIMGGWEHKSWDPGDDLGRLITGDWIAILFILLTILISWACFRRRGLE